ncbi:cupredoxin domain-containing protein [Salinithrix halophila]|uniref:Cupredoxin domain-containing protein n=2 Tax=Salinithrix halophila TaxID=1485204 RepID=A0ABV8JH25_9BACL
MTTSRQWFYLSLAFAFVLIGTSALLPIPWFGGKTVLEEVSTETSDEKTFHLITTEYKSEDKGKGIEIYRWDPGTIVVNRGDRVKLVMHGVHGREHHYSLTEFGVSGTVRKGQVSTATFTADKAGTFELVCHNHHGSEKNGPMVAYITVLESTR